MIKHKFSKLATIAIEIEADSIDLQNIIVCFKKIQKNILICILLCNNFIKILN